MQTPPAAARRHHGLSALYAKRAVTEAQKARRANRPTAAVAAVVATHQIASARESQAAVGTILAEQKVDAPPEAVLNLASFATALESFTQMLEGIDTDFEFARLVASLVQDAGNAAEQVSVATRPEIGWTRMLTPPSCSRCVVLAGRIYRYSDGFMRHPQDDCVTIPVAEGDETYTADPVELLKAGQVTGLSKADQQAILDGADFGQVVNSRRIASQLTEAGHTLTRGGRPTPAGIYRLASDRAEALALLQRYRYIT
jgi:hypothetical protein